MKVLAEYDACSGDGDKGALLRREGLYSSHLVEWRRARVAQHPVVVRSAGSQCGVGNGRTIAWTAHDDEFSSGDRSLAVAEQPAEDGEPDVKPMVNFISIIVRRSGAMSLKPC